ncbi:hypothetical protein AIG97_24355 [Salmonella enterica subsp. enterica serovar Thompson]|nr:hypothetical protein [Salmonella enterica subsp. enterica serovar Thompson]
MIFANLLVPLVTSSPRHLVTSSPRHLVTSSPLTSHLSPLTSSPRHLSPLTSHLSPLTSHLSPLTSHPKVYNLFLKKLNDSGTHAVLKLVRVNVNRLVLAPDIF